MFVTCPIQRPSHVTIRPRFGYTTLYVLLGLVVVAGVIDASYRGFDVFGVWSVPQFGSGDRATRHSIDEWHELVANALMIVAAVHGLAALGHHYVWRDDLLDRMRP